MTYVYIPRKYICESARGVRADRKKQTVSRLRGVKERTETERTSMGARRSMSINKPLCRSSMKASRRTKGMYAYESPSRGASRSSIRSPSFYANQLQYHHASQRFDQEKQVERTHREWNVSVAVAPTLTTKKSPGDPDLISGREKLHGCQMVKKERVCPTRYSYGVSFFSLSCCCTTIIYIPSLDLLAERPQEDENENGDKGGVDQEWIYGRGETSEELRRASSFHYSTFCFLIFEVGGEQSRCCSWRTIGRGEDKVSECLEREHSRTVSDDGRP